MGDPCKGLTECYLTANSKGAVDKLAGGGYDHLARPAPSLLGVQKHAVVVQHGAHQKQTNAFSIPVNRRVVSVGHLEDEIGAVSPDSNRNFFLLEQSCVTLCEKQELRKNNQVSRRASSSVE